jgi:hypothetical protein
MSSTTDGFELLKLVRAIRYALKRRNTLREAGEVLGLSVQGHELFLDMGIPGNSATQAANALTDSSPRAGRHQIASAGVAPAAIARLLAGQSP